MKTFNKSDWNNSKYMNMEHNSENVNCNLIIDCGDSKYGFTSNNEVITESCITSDAISLYKESSLLWLTQQQGYYYNSECTASKRYATSVKREIRLTDGYNNALTFLINIPLDMLINIRYMLSRNEKFSLVLPRDTTCGLVDFWRCCGSRMEIALMTSVVIPSYLIWDIDIDDNTAMNDNISIQECYGFSTTAWQQDKEITIIRD